MNLRGIAEKLIGPSDHGPRAKIETGTMEEGLKDENYLWVLEGTSIRGVGLYL